MGVEQIARPLIVAIVVALVVPLYCYEATAQTTIEINDGQILRFADLLAGSFQGSEFELGPNTTFQVNNGGRIDGRTENLNLGTFDFAGSTIDVNGGSYTHCTSFGCGIASNLHLNVYGGFLHSDFRPGSGTIANIYGGSVGRLFTEAGSLVNIHGNTTTTATFLLARPGSTANISGSRIRTLDVPDGSDVTLIGGEFRLNGSDYNEPTVSLVPGDVFSGTLSDGSVFIIDPATNLRYSNIKLETVPLPEITANDVIIDGTEEAAPANYRRGQSVTIRDGGVLVDPGFSYGIFAQGATINIEGGIVVQQSRVVESKVTISGGQVGNRFEAYLGSTVNVTGGTFQSDAWARAGSVWEIHDGNLGVFFTAWGGSEVSVFGGNFGSGFTSLPDSTVNIYGGTLSGLRLVGGTTNVFVKSATLDGVPLDLERGVPLEITERNNELLQVVLSDGSLLSVSLYPFEGKGPTPIVGFDADLFVTLVPEPPAFHLVALSIAVACLCYRKRQDFCNVHH